MDESGNLRVYAIDLSYRKTGMGQNKRKQSKRATFFSELGYLIFGGKSDGQNGVVALGF